MRRPSQPSTQPVLGFVGTLLACSLCANVIVGAQTVQRPRRSTTAPAAMTPAAVFAKYAATIVVIETFAADGSPAGQASGVVVQADGVIATNAHVIDNAASAVVRTADRVFPVTHILFADRNVDLALLKIAASALPVTQLAPRVPAVGTRVVAIGNPRGLEKTISDGLVSGIRHQDGVDWLQHTASISPGSSGGALFDLTGRLVGVTTSSLVESQNINFSVPSTVVSGALIGTKGPVPAPTMQKHAESLVERRVSDVVSALRAGDYRLVSQLGDRISSLAPGDSRGRIARGIAHAQSPKEERLALAMFDSALSDPSLTPEWRNTGILFVAVARAQLYIREDPGVARGDLLTAIRHVIERQGRTLLGPEDDERYAKWAASVLNRLTSLSGQWVEQTAKLMVLWKGPHTYELTSEGDAVLRVAYDRVNDQGRTVVSGQLARSSKIFAGELEVTSVLRTAGGVSDTCLVRMSVSLTPNIEGTLLKGTITPTFSEGTLIGPGVQPSKSYVCGEAARAGTQAITLERLN
jgi:hypothetical protein